MFWVRFRGSKQNFTIDHPYTRRPFSNIALKLIKYENVRKMQEFLKFFFLWRSGVL